jgi:endonuclease-3
LRDGARALQYVFARRPGAFVKPNYRARCTRINRLLTTAYGQPTWPGPQDPFDVLIKTLVAQVASAAVAEKVYKILSDARGASQEGSEKSPEAVGRALRAGGLATQKAKNVVKLVKDLKKEYGTTNLDFIKTMSVREAMRALESIEGVGSKTGACVILFSLGREICPVDTHIHRVLHRVGIVPNNATPESAFEMLQPLIPSGQSYAFHVNMIKLGREVCKAGKPKCGECPVETECRYPAKRIAGRSR